MAAAPGAVASADDFGRLEEEGRRDGEAQRLGGLQVDHQLRGKHVLYSPIRFAQGGEL
jgi:hypothetical protein